MRKAGAGESLWLRLGEGGSTNIRLTYEIEGALDQERMRRAVMKLQESQEYLNCHFRSKGKGYQIYKREAVNPPYEYQNFDSQEKFMEAMNLWSNKQITENDDLPWRIVHGELEKDGSVLTQLCYISHHAFTDGRSASLLKDRLLKFYYLDDYEVQAVPFRKMYESYLPKTRFKEKYQALSVIMKYLKSVKKGEFFNHPQPENVDVELVSKKLNFRMSLEETKAFFKQVKADSRKAHSIFCAAYVKAMYELYELEGEQAMSFSCPVDYRHLLEGDFNDDVAFLIAPININVTFNAQDSLREVADRIQEDLDVKTKPAFLRLALGLYKKVLKKHSCYKTFSTYLRDQSVNLGVISNMGAFKLPVLPNGETVKDYHGAASTQGVQKPSVSFLIATVEGRLGFDITYGESFISTEFADNVGNKILQQLKAY